MTSVQFTQLPDTDGATQTRSFTVQLTTPDGIGLQQTALAVGIDATQNGSFRELVTKRASYPAGETTTESFRQFIGVAAPYDLRIIATFTATDGSEQTVQTARTVAETQSASDDAETLTADERVRDPLPQRSGDEVAVTPRIGPIEPITMNARYQLPWQRESNQTACGKTIQRQNGDLDWRIVFECVMTLTQLDRLRQLRSESGRVTTRSAVFGVRDVVFDQLNIERPDEEKLGELDGTPEPLYQVQLQTKELEDDEAGLFGDE